MFGGTPFSPRERLAKSIFSNKQEKENSIPAQPFAQASPWRTCVTQQVRSTCLKHSTQNSARGQEGSKPGTITGSVLRHVSPASSQHLILPRKSAHERETGQRRGGDGTETGRGWEHRTVCTVHLILLTSYPNNFNKKEKRK